MRSCTRCTRPAPWCSPAACPSERGHRLLARSFGAILRERGVNLRELDPEPTNPPPTRLASLRWLATKGTKWVLDRSTDLVPNLIRLSVVEFWHGVRGLTARLDQRITADIRSTIDAIETIETIETAPAPVWNRIG
jgi:hypothetical protein